MEDNLLDSPHEEQGKESGLHTIKPDFSNIPGNSTVVNIASYTDWNNAATAPHKQVLQKILQQVEPINFRDYIMLPDDEDVKQKHIVVAVIKHLLETAKNNNWNMCKSYDYVYNGAYWQQLEKDDLKNFLGEYAIRLGCPDYDAKHFEFKEKLFKQFLCEAYLPQPTREENKILINLLNGTLEFMPQGWTLRDFQVNDFMTYQLPFNYDAAAPCPMFDNYLLKVLPDEDLRQILQEYSGYIFSGLNLEKMLMLIGNGANGKSVFFKVINALLGKSNVLTYSLGLFNHEYNRSKLVNILLNYSSEKGTDINPDTFKALVSSEPLQAREPYGKPFTLYNRVRFIINANELPKETEQTEAYFRRWVIVPFEITIPEAERDSELAEKIISTELSGVMNWLLGGLERLTENKKFAESDKAKTSLKVFREQSDSVGLWVTENFYIPSSNSKMALHDLYHHYKGFCSDDGYKPVGKNKFAARLENKGFDRTRLGDGSAAFFIQR